MSAAIAAETEAELDGDDRRGSLPSTAMEAEAQTDTSTSRGSLVTFTSPHWVLNSRVSLAPDTVEF